MISISRFNHLRDALLIFVFGFVSILTNAQDGFNAKEQARAKTCLRIFDEIKEAQGLTKLDKPELKMVVSLNPNTLKIALVNNQGVVQFDRASMNLCFEMGKDSLNAVAFVLSHELAHYVHQHVIVNKFLEDQVGIAEQGQEIRTQFIVGSRNTEQAIDTNNISLAFNEVLQNLKIREHEAQADLEAGFTSYLAGYETKEAGPNFFEKAYDKFRMHNVSKKYVSLPERQEIMRYAGKKIDTLIQVFEVANYLTTIKNFELAEHCYEYVVKEYQNKVILNNLGVLHLRKYITTSNRKFHKYALPITIDLEVSDKGIDDPEEEFNRFEAPLLKAIHYFEKANSQSKTYSLAYLNKSVAHLLLYELKTNYNHVANLAEDDLIFAKSAALQAKQVELKPLHNDVNTTLSQAYGMLAVISHELGASSKSVDSLFTLGMKEFPLNPVITKNKDIIFSDGESPSDETDEDSNGVTCTALDASLSKPVSEGLELPFSAFDFKLQLASSTDTSIFFTARKLSEGNHYNVFKSAMQDNLMTKIINRVGIMVPNDFSINTACNVSSKSTLKELQTAFGTPTDTILISKGSLFYYKGKNRRFSTDYIINDGIIFNVVNEKNAQGIIRKVKNWAYLQRQKLPE